MAALPGLLKQLIAVILSARGKMQSIQMHASGLCSACREKRAISICPQTIPSCPAVTRMPQAQVDQKSLWFLQVLYPGASSQHPSTNPLCKPENRCRGSRVVAWSQRRSNGAFGTPSCRAASLASSSRSQPSSSELGASPASEAKADSSRSQADAMATQNPSVGGRSGWVRCRVWGGGKVMGLLVAHQLSGHHGWQGGNDQKKFRRTFSGH